MTNSWGLHLPNGSIRNDECFKLGVSNTTLLHMQANYLQRCVESFNGTILIRFYLERWLSRNPIEWASECAAIWRSNQLLRDTDRVHFTPANEQNLAGEAYGSWSDGALQAICESRLHYEAINNWNLIWLQEFVRLTGCSTHRLHWPAVAYGHNDDDDAAGKGFVGLEVCRSSIEAYGYLDVHPYWSVGARDTYPTGEVVDQVVSKYHGHRFELVHAMFPDKPIYLSEAGNFAVTDGRTPAEIVRHAQSLAAFPYVRGVTWFMWEDPTKVHWQNDWSKNPNIAKAVKAANKTELANWQPVEESGGDTLAAQYRWGNKALAEKLGTGVVGDARTDEIYDGDGNSVQFTSQGWIVYNKSRAKSEFFQATSPKS